jgi:hypothetical protein
MTDTFTELTEAEFNELYRPLTNPINPNAPCDIGDAKGCLIETFGAEWDFIRSYDRRRVWTIIDNNDGGEYLIISGLRWVNRLGYLITENPWPEDHIIEVNLDT